MCGRYLLTAPPAALAAQFGLAGPLPNFGPRYNIAPTQGVLIVRRGGLGRELGAVRWGLVPSWAKELGSKPLINARSETVAEKPAFRAAFRRRRCLVPADGFYEWQEGAGGRRQPFLIRRRDRATFAMAGLWEAWQSPDGAEVQSMAILTTEANASLVSLHDRMPVILAEDAWEPWLMWDERRTPELLGFLRPAPDDLLDLVPVSTAVNRVANDGPDLIRPLAEDESAGRLL